ncbi:MAG: phosphatase PAP2 family protein [Longicatena sp.]
MKVKAMIPYGIGILACLIGAFYDYQITDTLYQSIPWLGIFFERFVLIPIQFVIVISFTMLYRKYKNIIFIIFGYCASLYVLKHTLSYWMNTKGLMMIILVALIALCILMGCVWIIQKLPQKTFDDTYWFFMFMGIVLLSSMVFTSIIKGTWGRIRYREMKDAAQFCVWYKPCGIAGSRSFPSGHMTAFSAILCLLPYIDKRNNQQRKIGRISVMVLLILMAISRMIMGAHFLSDVAMGFMITYSCYLVTRKYMRKRGVL